MILICGLSTDPTIQHTLVRAHSERVHFQFFDLLRFYSEGEAYWDSKHASGFFFDGRTQLSLPDDLPAGIYARVIDVSEHAPDGARSSWKARYRLVQEFLRTVPTNVVNRPHGDVSNFTKPYHAKILEECGFRIPDTLITNSLSDALEFCRGREVICKGISSDKTRAFLINDQILRQKLPGTASPVLLQQRIDGADVRVHKIGGDFYAQAIVSDAIDYRFDKVPKRFFPLDLPASVRAACSAYASFSGYTFIGFDLRMTRDGEFFALEANPMPGYDAYDRRLNYQISSSLLTCLRGSNFSHG